MDALNNFKRHIRGHNDFTPYDVVFCSYYVPNRVCSGISKWFPISSDTRKKIEEVITKMDYETKGVFELYFGFHDGHYYSINEVAKKMDVPWKEVAICFGPIEKLFYDSRDAVYNTLSKEAREQIMNGYNLEEIRKRHYLWE